MKMVKYWIVALALTGLFVAGCANEEGDEVECPVCDEATETLVGTQCVPYEEVEVCGPDGHLHGPVCHCFGGQEVTNIDGVDYCLQEVCGVVSAKVEADESPVEGDEHEGHEHAEEGDEHHEGEEHAEEGDEHHEGEEHAEEGDEDHEGDEHAEEGDEG